MNNIRKVIGITAIAAGIVVSNLGATTSCPANDPGKPTKPGHAKKVTVRILPGLTTVTSSQYGIWHASDSASSKCRWVINTDKGVISSGGPKDHMVIGTGSKGATIIMSSSCVEFEKGW